MTCQRCGGRVPLRAEQCPHCGAPVERSAGGQDVAARWQAWSRGEESLGGSPPGSRRPTGPPSAATPRTGSPLPQTTGPVPRVPPPPAAGRRQTEPSRTAPWAGSKRSGGSRPPAAPPKQAAAWPNARRGEPAPEELSPPRPPRGWGEPRAVALVGILAALVAVLGLVLGVETALSGPPAQLAVPRRSAAGVSTTSAAAHSAGPSVAKPPVELAKLARVEASDTAYARYDDCNRRFEYNASNTLDGNPATAWRVSGDGTGETLTFTFEDPHVITGLGLINGHAKKDACSGADRYPQERRITRVTWTFDGKHALVQKLSIKDRAIQRLPVDSVVATSVTLKIEATALPSDGRLDYTPISEVSLRGH